MSMLPQPWQPLMRNDRQVRRAILHLPAGVSEHRATLLVEEALRLMALPGEDQGRTYYFRRVALRGVAVAAAPNEWVARVQSTMHGLAARALHGADVRAGDADAVFFYSQEEAMEWLLQRLLRAWPREANAGKWFAAMIAPAMAGADATKRVVGLIERLRSLPSGWFAAATVLLGVVERNSAALAVLKSIPERVVRTWLRELGGEYPGQSHAAWISETRKGVLRRRLVGFRQEASVIWGSGSGKVGAESYRRGPVQLHLPLCLVWLGALAVVAEDPGVLARGSAVASARVILEEGSGVVDLLQEEDRRKQAAVSLRESKEGSSNAWGSDGPRTTAGAEAQCGVKDEGDLKSGLDCSQDASLFTTAGGLYFLLNVLRLLGIETAIKALPSPVRKAFLPKLIRSLARAASVNEDDPVRMWIVATLDAAGQQEDLGAMIFAAECWPYSMLAAPKAEVIQDRLIRAWTVAARRWCWLNARLTLRETVLRPGRILLTRTDLDVTLSMDSVDLRIRRVGLDLDPGWLPWFGRVVRFHYVYEAMQSGVAEGEFA